MTQTKLTILGYGTGVVVAIGSFYRWTVFHSDLKQTLIGVGLGFLVLGFAYLYQRIAELEKTDEKNKEETDEDIKDLHTGLDGLKIWAVDEIEKLKR